LTYTYAWSNGATTEDLATLTAGTYVLTITDNNGCTTIDSTTLTNNTFGFGIAGAQITDELCGNGAGAIDLTAAGGTAPYAFNWSNGATTEDLASLSAATYDVTITDNAGCVVTQSYTVVNSTNNFNATATTTVANCSAADGGIDVTVTGGAMPYTFNWSTGATTEDLSNLNSGAYDVTIADANGCEITTTYTVGNSGGTLGLTSTPTAATCGQANGGMTLNVTGGTMPYAYNWSTGSTNASISGVVAGNYAVTVSDANGCELTVPANIPNIGAPIDLVGADTTTATCANCSNGGVDLTLGGAGAPYTFNWSNNATSEDLVNVLPGAYSVTITSVDGCTFDTTFTVSFTTGLVELEGMNINIYPNPSTGRVFVEFSQTPMDEIQIEVFNAVGQLVVARRYEAQSIQERLPVDLEEVSSGTYMLKISSGKAYTTQKIIILKE